MGAKRWPRTSKESDVRWSCSPSRVSRAPRRFSVLREVRIHGQNDHLDNERLVRMRDGPEVP
jgi:hypothetical protein